MTAEVDRSGDSVRPNPTGVDLGRSRVRRGGSVVRGWGDSAGRFLAHAARVVGLDGATLVLLDADGAPVGRYQRA